MSRTFQAKVPAGIRIRCDRVSSGGLTARRGRMPFYPMRNRLLARRVTMSDRRRNHPAPPSEARTVAECGSLQLWRLLR